MSQPKGIDFFPSRWPIMCAVMNGVSDLSLALAVHEAGAMPSLMVNGEHRIEKLGSVLREFVKSVGHANLVLSLNYYDLVNIDIVKLVRQYKVSHVELLGMTSQQEFDHVMSEPLVRNGLKFVQSTTKIMIRIFSPTQARSQLQAYALKGSDSGGFTGNLSVSELFVQQQQLTPGMKLIPYGGIGTAKQVAEYIRRGAAAVAVGTLFAATKESCLAESVKQQMILSSSTALTKFTTSQQALVLGPHSEVVADITPNRQASLESGIAGQGGLIYAGKSIDYVTKTRSVQEVVDYLTSEL